MSWTWLGDTTPVARKDYQCCLCELVIPKGKKHIARRGICDDRPITSRMHIACVQLTRDLNWGEWDWETATDAQEFRGELARKEDEDEANMEAS